MAKKRKRPCKRPAQQERTCEQTETVESISHKAPLCDICGGHESRYKFKCCAWRFCGIKCFKAHNDGRSNLVVAEQPTVEKAEQPTVEKAEQPTVEKAEQPTVEKAEQPTVEQENSVVAEQPAIDRNPCGGPVTAPAIAAKFSGRWGEQSYRSGNPRFLGNRFGTGPSDERRSGAGASGFFATTDAADEKPEDGQRRRNNFRNNLPGPLMKHRRTSLEPVGTTDLLRRSGGAPLENAEALEGGEIDDPLVCENDDEDDSDPDEDDGGLALHDAQLQSLMSNAELRDYFKCENIRKSVRAVTASSMPVAALAWHLQNDEKFMSFADAVMNAAGELSEDFYHLDDRKEMKVWPEEATKEEDHTAADAVAARAPEQQNDVIYLSD